MMMLNRTNETQDRAPYLDPSIILLADDDAEDRNFFEEALAMIEEPLQLVMVNDGEELIDYLKESPSPQLIFLDLNMPRKNGSQCLAYIKSNPLLTATPVVILSTSINEAKNNQLVEEGAACCFNKPTEFSSLVAILRRSVQLLPSAIRSTAETQ